MKLKALAFGLLATSALVACQAEQEEGAGNGNYNGVENTRFEREADDMYEGGNRVDNVDNDRGMIHNTNFQVAERAAERISQDVKGVKRAYVLTTRDKAYVAVIRDGEKGNNNGNKNSANNNNKENAELGEQFNNENGAQNTRNQNEDRVSKEMKKQIVKIVKQTDQDINDVYVSTNPDFVDLTNNYINDVNNGEPVEGFFREFGKMAERIFPDAE
ncbi:YhcN/YlaJ family sporulation lipoprotein [Thalassobacillus pellis]|uniref:YhcN/YlaJ family sporulation lipoprotein n=1 Tax=Thalassobacillus pellis TaxID=748008 RepID=UPI0019621AFC|nr:YhcN/YlaJ family sporulation lipoprotein [Thalassobacillus pellis]MBM7551172.1 YhcN/YlaJ family sporulation lipoprotein [Thalassobacillus pellis]